MKHPDQHDLFRPVRPRIPLATETRDAAYAEVAAEIETAFDTGGRVDLSPRQLSVYVAIRSYPGGLTNAELGEFLNWSVNRVTPRTFELRALKLVTKGPKRRCTTTGFRAQTWIALP